MLSTYRHHDAVLIVCQNNAKRMVEISAANAEAEAILGYNSQELAGKPISLVLPQRIDASLREYIEFSDKKNDLGDVLIKVRDFALKNRQGKEVSFKVRVVRCAPMDNNPWFHLVLLDEAAQRRTQAFRQVLSENFKGHEVLNENTGLPNRVSMLKDLQLTLYHANSREIQACFALADIDNYADIRSRYGDTVALNMHRHIANLFKQKLRGDDTLGTISDQAIGVILMDADAEAARMVFNRLRWSITGTALRLPDHGEVSVSVTLAFTRVEGNISETDIIEKCEAYIRKLHEKPGSGNTVHEVFANERRGDPDRRKKTPTVIDNERRKEDRRNT